MASSDVRSDLRVVKESGQGGPSFPVRRFYEILLITVIYLVGRKKRTPLPAKEGKLFSLGWPFDRKCFG